MEYWNNRGKFQAIYDQLQPRADQDTDNEYFGLLKTIGCIYYDYFNNGDKTWYSIVNNNAYDLDYSPPQDAPFEVHAFFQNARQAYKDMETMRVAVEKVEAQSLYKKVQLSLDAHEDLTPAELDAILDIIIPFVARNVE